MIDKVLRIRTDGTYQIGTVSVPRELAQGVADSLYFLMRRESAFGKSRSEVICEAIVGYAKEQGMEETTRSE